MSGPCLCSRKLKDAALMFKYKSVLNTDGYDRRRYAELRAASQKLALVEKEGSQSLPTFPDLLGDTWAALFKNNPEVLDDPPAEVLPHVPLLKAMQDLPEFQALREYTRLDELASALGAAQMGGRLGDYIAQQKEALKKMQQAAASFQKAESLSQKSEAEKEAAQLTQNTELEKQAKANRQKANRQAKKGQQLNQEAMQALADYLASENGQKKLQEAVVSATEGTKQQNDAVNSLVSGLGYNNAPGDPQAMSLAEKLQLAEAVQKNPTLLEIARLAGRMKKIAGKKQKTKSRTSPAFNSVDTGSNLERLLPSELLMLARPETKLDFMRRYTEGKTLQYAPQKEKLGKGPIVVCLDTSGSMRGIDPEAKAVMLALLAVAQKQRRAFAVINFSSAEFVNSWSFPGKAKIPPKTIIEMATFFYGHGTDFQAPLNTALEIINTSSFKQADVIFITDGAAAISSDWLKDFLEKKKQKAFQVISVQLNYDSDYRRILEQFSDRVISASSLFDQEAIDSIFSV